MKNTITLFYLVLATTGLLAQNLNSYKVEDIELVEAVIPSLSTTLVPGMSYNFNIKVRNAGGSFPCACFDYTLVVGNDTVKGSILTISFFNPGDTVEITTSNELTISPGNNGNAIAYISGVNDVNQNNDTLHLSYNIDGSTGISDDGFELQDEDIYFSPNMEKLVFKMVNDAYLPDQLILYTMTGSVVREYGSGTIENSTNYMDTMGLPAGIYIAAIRIDGKTYSKKLAIY